MARKQEPMPDKEVQLALAQAELIAHRLHPAYDYGYSNGWADCFEDVLRRLRAGEDLLKENADG